MTASGPDRRLVVGVVVAVVVAFAVSIPLIVALVARQSSASFADTEVLDANRLGAARVGLEVTATPTNQPDDQPSNPDAGAPVDVVFSALNLAPGDSVSGHLEMTNIGDVPLRFGLSAMTDGGQLGHWLRFELWAGTDTCSPGQPGPRVIEDVQLGPTPVVLIDQAPEAGVNVAVDVDNVLPPGETALWCVGATLPIDTPNEAQAQSLEMTLLVPVQQVAEGQ